MTYDRFEVVVSFPFTDEAQVQALNALQLRIAAAGTEKSGRSRPA